MKSMFESASGTIIGFSHLQAGKNNQDAFFLISENRFTVAVACDGCSSGVHSEVGAALGARLVATQVERTLLRQFNGTGKKPIQLTVDILERIRLDVLAEVRVLVNAMGGSFSQTVSDYFLFTVVGVVVTPALTTIFSLGDGFVSINGDVESLGPFPGNAPPYLGYGLTGSSLEETNPDGLKFRIVRQLPTEVVKSVVIGTDGVADLLQLAEKQLPGKTEPVGPVSQFWEEDRYFENPDALRRRLAQINTEFRRPDWENRRMERQAGLLQDDTTLVVLRRRELAM
ncbi:MAG: protein phosphatase 2C domain-containing protein [Blastocatellia bacterium]|nr:protein phosphatase 2C domain-containing protein [Blastocatellia bacterium]